MEVCLPGSGLDTQPWKLSFSSSKRVVQLHKVLRSRKLCIGFENSGHSDYYVSVKAGMKKEKKNLEAVGLKKKLKLMKGMSKDLLKFSSMGFGVGDGEIKGKRISEATEILLAQLKQLKAEEKELKRKRKEEKAKQKAAQFSIATVCESSSTSSSESSDSECGEVIDMNSLRNGATAEPQIELPVKVVSTSPDLVIEEIKRVVTVDRIQDRNLPSCSSESSVVVGTSAEKIEVCMGGKCKKSGASALLEEFQHKVGVQGVVVGCKCMGKCRDGPNVRIVNECNADLAENLDGPVRPQTNPLCIGVGLEDVGVIVANFLGQERQDLGLMVA
ncbi:hypothetical protein IFM89_018624 [Coptis chinensis]|uniref:Diacylglycerol O-acyltransferase 3, cytosolic n=1 Tax=Coptis chinensis TaxID=261450 RepID=A0A835H7B5_9MAGN|nr:hypothetical protein IFM89_018624 [Coptis chinensis]